MSDITNIIDEYKGRADFYEMQASNWRYIATLLMRWGGKDELRFTKAGRDIGKDVLDVTEMKGGGLKIVLRVEESEDAT
jgi:hypothetical protein